jgi:hypothetical protein
MKPSTILIALAATLVSPACHDCQGCNTDDPVYTTPPITAELPAYCNSHAECDDGSICTVDYCLVDHSCGNITKYLWCGDNVYSDGGTCPASISDLTITSCLDDDVLRAVCVDCTVDDETLAAARENIMPYFWELVDWVGYMPPVAVDQYYGPAHRTLNLALFSSGSGERMRGAWEGAIIGEGTFTNESPSGYLDDEGIPRAYEANTTHELAHAFLWSPFCGGVWNHGLVEFLEDVIVFDKIYIEVYNRDVEAVNAGVPLIEVASHHSQPDRQIGYALFGTLWKYHGCGKECVREILHSVYDSWLETEGESTCLGPEFIEIVNRTVGHDVTDVVTLSGLGSQEEFDNVYSTISGE